MKNKNTIISLICFFSIVLLGIGSFNACTSYAPPEYEEAIKLKEKKYSELSKEYSVMSKEYSEMSKKYSDGESELKKAKKDFATADKRLKDQETYFEDILKQKENVYLALQDSLKRIAIKSKTSEKATNNSQKESDVMIYLNRQGPIAFYCPQKMKEEVTYEVRAMLGSVFEKKELEKKLLETVNERRQERNETPILNTEIKTKDVNLGVYLKIELIDDAGNKFNVIIPSEKQSKNPLVKIYNENTNEYFDKTFEWSWKVTPKANTRGEASLTLVVTPYDKNMEPLEGKNREYKIKIVLKENFFVAFWDKVNRNPEWTFASIIAPVISFFAGILFKRKKDNSNNEA